MNKHLNYFNKYNISKKSKISKHFGRKLSKYFKSSIITAF